MRHDDAGSKILIKLIRKSSCSWKRGCSCLQEAPDPPRRTLNEGSGKDEGVLAEVTPANTFQQRGAEVRHAGYAARSRACAPTGTNAQPAEPQRPGPRDAFRAWHRHSHPDCATGHTTQPGKHLRQEDLTHQQADITDDRNRPS